MKKCLLSILAALCFMVVAKADNPYATKVEYEPGKYMFFLLNDEEQTASVTWGGKYNTAGTEDYTGNIQIPGSITVEGVVYSVIRVSEYAFYGCSNLCSVSVPKGVTRIGALSFCSCTSLCSITLQEGVQSIGSQAFEDCIRLTSISLPEGVTDIGTETFRSCATLTSLTIPSTVTSIGGLLCQNANSLQEVFVKSDKLTSVGSNVWSATIPTYVTANSFLTYQRVHFDGYNVKVSPDEELGELLQAYLNLSDDEVELYDELLKVRGTMARKQDGTAVEITGKDGETIKLYNVKNVKFSNEDE